MTTAITIAELLGRGTELSVAEAIAIVHALIDAPVPLDVELREPYGPPCPDNLELHPDGSIVCTGCATTPAVSELAILIERLLEHAPGIPGRLRYTIGRALLDVEAPPFDSLEEFSSNLARFADGDYREILRRLAERADRRLRPMNAPRLVSMRTPPPAPAARDRRQHGPRSDQLRRELREADQRLYAREHPLDLELSPPLTTSAAPPPSSRFWPRAAAVAALLLVALVAGVSRSHRATTDPPAQRSAALAARSTAASAGNRAATTPARDAAPAVKPPAGDARAPVPARASVNADEPSVKNVAERHVAAGADEDGWLVPTLDVNQRPVFSPAFASNGSAIFFHPGQSGDARSALMNAGDAGNELRVMTILDDGARNYHVQPSPDGRQIAFDSDRDGDRGVYTANRDGTNVRRVSGPGFAAVPTWSPDGTQLAFVRAEPHNARVWNLWLLTIATGETERLTDYRYGQPWSASWFPDGGRIAYAHEDRLYILDLSTRRTRSFAAPVAGHLVRTPAVSPDGSRVVFQVHRNGVWLLDIADGSMRCVLQDPTAGEFAWTPDGRRIAFHSRRDGQWGIYVMAKQ